jgi:hypothetical protein
MYSRPTQVDPVLPRQIETPARLALERLGHQEYPPGFLLVDARMGQERVQLRTGFNRAGLIGQGLNRCIVVIHHAPIMRTNQWRRLFDSVQAPSGRRDG